MSHATESAGALSGALRERYIDFARSCGWTVLSEGVHKTVFHSHSHPYLVAVVQATSGSDRSVRVLNAWVSFCRKYPDNPYLPTFRTKVVQARLFPGLYMVQCEHLSHVKNLDRRVQAFVDLLSFQKARGGAPRKRPTADTADAHWDRVMREVSESFLLDSTVHAPAFQPFLATLRRVLLNTPPGAEFDLAGALMRRVNTLVINDPWL